MKPADTYRIFLFGESAAWGDPDPTFGVGRYLKVLLQERFPGTDFDVVCVAMTAINSHVILPIARECAHYEGDLWVVYMGHNEMVGPFGAATVFGPRSPPRGLVRTILAAKKSRLGQWLEATARSLRSVTADGQSWGGLEMFTQHRLSIDDPARQRAYGSFQGNLEDLLRSGCEAGVPILVSTLASNLKDCGPFAGDHVDGLSEAGQKAVQALLEEGGARESQQAYARAAECYERALRIAPGGAWLHYRLGQCQLAMTNLTEARRTLEQARDLDSLVFRADTQINTILKDTVARFDNSAVFLVDSAEALARCSPGGVPGKELFYEHVHLHFAGNYQLARVWGEAIAPRLPAAITARDRRVWASAEACHRALAVTPWDEYRLWQTNMRRLQSPPFTNQPDHDRHIAHYQTILRELEAGLTRAALERARATYQEAVAAAPTDYLLHANQARFLETRGDFPVALREWEQCRELLPQVSFAHQRIGRILHQQGEYSKAADAFLQSIALRDDEAEVHLALALAYENAGSTKQALEAFRGVLRRDPKNEAAVRHVKALLAKTQRQP